MTSSRYHRQVWNISDCIISVDVPEVMEKNLHIGPKTACCCSYSLLN